MVRKARESQNLRGRVGKFFANLGPGLITGAADDDPSGIATYSVSGARFGYAPLWTALFSFPMMVAVQLMCARLGMVTGCGLAASVRQRYPRWVLAFACLLLAVANTINIGADLSGMAESMEMLTGVPSPAWTPIFTALIVLLIFRTSYRQIARVFKWLTLALFSYVLTAILVRPDWSAVARATLTPEFHWSRGYLSVLVGILGTTISPYLFFWQAAEEVEEERAKGRRSATSRRGATKQELRESRTDVLTGMFFSNAVMYFIILTTGATLHAHGRFDIENARQAAEALRPLAGEGAYLLFALGLIGTGMLAVPVLAGSCAYAISDAFGWKEASLGQKPGRAPKFYLVLAVAMALGMALDFVGFEAVKMLFWSAVINGILSPPLIVIIVLLTSDRAVMGKWVNPPWLRWLGWITAAVMAAAAAGMFIAR